MNKICIIILLSISGLVSSCLGQCNDNNLKQTDTYFSESIYKNLDDINFIQFRSLFPCISLSDSCRILTTGNTICMNGQYHKFLTEELIKHTGTFLTGNFFYYDNYYVAFYNYMEEHPGNRRFYTHILLYDNNGTILKELRTINGLDNPEYIGEWQISRSEIKQLYFGPYINNDSHPVNCKETTYTLSTNSPLAIIGECQYYVVKQFVW